MCVLNSSWPTQHYCVAPEGATCGHAAPRCETSDQYCTIYIQQHIEGCLQASWWCTARGSIEVLTRGSFCAIETARELQPSISGGSLDGLRVCDLPSYGSLYFNIKLTYTSLKP